ncbi:MAG: hypothetical protein KBT00_07595, partial [Bacteroidales bacterium]|nr:hypothetical protein [Candidatus Cacconaster merdequi]
ISQEAVTGPVPNSAIIEHFFALDMPVPAHFNQDFMLRSDKCIDAVALKQALSALVSHHDMLRAKVQGNALYLRDTDEETLYGWRESDLRGDSSCKEKVAMTGSEIHRSISLEKGPLFNAALFRMDDGDALLLVCHHLVVDGVSWRIIVEDLNTAYALALEGKSVVLPAKTHSYKTYAEALHEYASSYQLSQEIGYWENVSRRMAASPRLKRKDEAVNRKFHAVKLDAETTGLLIGKCSEAYDTEINDLLLTGLVRSYKRLTGFGSLAVSMEGHGREPFGKEPLTIDRTVGWFTSIYPVVLDITGEDLRSDIRNVKEELHRIPNKGFGYNVLKYITGVMPEAEMPMVTFNYLGEFSDGGKTGEDNAEGLYMASDLSSGEAVDNGNIREPVSVNSSVINGEMLIPFAYDANLLDEESIRQWGELYLDELKGIAEHTMSVEHPEHTASDLGEMEWSDDEFQVVEADFAKRGERLERIYPLTPMQESMLLKHLAEPQAWAYRIVNIFELSALPSEEQLSKALDRLAASNEVLRTSIISNGVSIYRQAIVDRKLGLYMHDLSGEEDPEKAVLKLREEYLTNGFDLQEKPLAFVVCAAKSDTSCYLLLGIHHIIVDGWCMQTFIGGFIQNLMEEISGVHLNHSNERSTAGRYEEAVREIIHKDKQASLKYWKEFLSGYETRAEIPSGGPVAESDRSDEDVILSYVDKDSTDRLSALCQQEDITFSTIVEMSWGMVLQVYARTNDVVFAKVVSGRDNTSVEVGDVFGLFINSIPVRVRSDKNTTVRQLLHQLSDQAAESKEHDFCPLAEIQQQSCLGSQLFQTVIAFENFDSGAPVHRETDTEQNSVFALKSILAKEENFSEINPSSFITDNGELCLKIAFDRKLYTKKAVKTIHSLFGAIVRGIASNPDALVDNLPRIDG